MTPAEVLTQLQEAVALHRQGALAEAAARYQDILREDPTNADALYLLGTAAFQAKGYPDALRWLQEAATARPQWAAAHHLAGLAQKELGRYDDALASFERAVAIEPGSVQFLTSRANAFNELSRFDDAAAAYGQVVALAPGTAEAWHNQSHALLQMRRSDEALASIERALALQPRNPHSELQRANCLRALGRLDESIASYDRLLTLEPAPFEALIGRALALHAAGRNDDALACCDQAQTVLPFSPNARFTRGCILSSMGEAAGALACFDGALAVAPDHGLSMHMRGVALNALERFAEALASLDKAQALLPRSGKLAADRAAALDALGRFDEAFAALDEALRLAPDEHEVRLTAARIELLHGRWPAGFEHYESRRHVGPDGDVGALAARYEMWRGEPPAGALLVLVADARLGDAIQAARFAPVLAAQGHKIAILAAPTLAPLFSRLRGIAGVFESADEILEETQPVRWLPMMSAARVLGVTPETVPQPAPYLSVDPLRVNDWREKLTTKGFKIGIAWQGNPQYQHDRGRSIPLAAFAPLVDIPGVRLISLQKEPGAEQAGRVPFGLQLEMYVHPADRSTNAFLDTAAIMMNVDLVVTSDTMVAHLAGALGRPVFVALRQIPDWRWLLGRDDSPWYASMRLFRQRQDGDWAEVFARIAAAAREMIEQR